MAFDNRSIFEKMIAGEMACDRVYEDEWVLVIRDIHPVAVHHLLIMPKRYIAAIQEMKEDDFFLLGHIVKTAQALAIKLGIDKTGYRLLTNNGPNAGQTIFHLHFHLIGGEPLGPMA